MSWSESARTSAIALMTGEERQDDSVTATLIRDISDVFDASGHDRMRTADLLAQLYEIEESPWGDWYGKPLSAHGLSRLLKAYRVRTMPVWADGKTVKGYKVEQFEDAFAQLGVRRVRTVRSESRSQAAPNPPNPPNPKGREMGEDDVECLLCGTSYDIAEHGSDEAACRGCAALARGVVTESEAEELRKLSRLYVATGSRP